MSKGGKTKKAKETDLLGLSDINFSQVASRAANQTNWDSIDASPADRISSLNIYSSPGAPSSAGSMYSPATSWSSPSAPPSSSFTPPSMHSPYTAPLGGGGSYNNATGALYNNGSLNHTGYAAISGAGAYGGGGGYGTSAYGPTASGYSAGNGHASPPLSVLSKCGRCQAVMTLTKGMHKNGDVIKCPTCTALNCINEPALGDMPHSPSPAVTPATASPVPASSPVPKVTLSSASSPGGDVWAPTAEDRAKYTKYFHQTDTDGDGYISGKEAADFLSMSGASREELRKIWNLGDLEKDGKLDLVEFMICMHLTMKVTKHGLPIPDKLPNALVPKKARAAMTSPPVAASPPVPATVSPPVTVPSPSPPMQYIVPNVTPLYGVSSVPSSAKPLTQPARSAVTNHQTYFNEVSPIAPSDDIVYGAPKLMNRKSSHESYSPRKISSTDPSSPSKLSSIKQAAAASSARKDREGGYGSLSCAPLMYDPPQVVRASSSNASLIDAMFAPSSQPPPPPVPTKFAVSFDAPPSMPERSFAPAIIPVAYNNNPMPREASPVRISFSVNGSGSAGPPLPDKFAASAPEYSRAPPSLPEKAHERKPSYDAPPPALPEKKSAYEAPVLAAPPLPQRASSSSPPLVTIPPPLPTKESLPPKFPSASGESVRLYGSNSGKQAFNSNSGSRTPPMLSQVKIAINSPLPGSPVSRDEWLIRNTRNPGLRFKPNLLDETVMSRRGEIRKESKAASDRDLTGVNVFDQRASLTRKASSGSIDDDETTLPVGWGSSVDDSGKVYYYNVSTGQSQWEVPVVGKLDSQSEAKLLTSSHDIRKSLQRVETFKSNAGIHRSNPGSNNKALLISTAGMQNIVLSADKAPLKKDWATAMDDEGDVYYYNNVTGETTWSKPVETAPTPAVAATTVPPTGPTRSKAWYRAQILKEIVDTERQYINALEALNRLFIKPLTDGIDKKKKSTKYLEAAEVAKIVPGDVDVIIATHQKILNKLSEGPQPNFTSDSLSDACLEHYMDVFREFIPKFEFIYTDYCRNYGPASEEVRIQREQNSVFDKLVKDFEKAAGVAFESMSVKPVQRLYKYPLFFNDLKKNTEDNHRLLGTLTKVGSIMAESAANVDRSIRAESGSTRILEISNLFGNSVKDLINPHRRYIYECEAKVVKSTTKMSYGNIVVDTTDAKYYSVYVFNDILLLGRPNMFNSTYLREKARFDLLQIDVQPAIVKNSSNQCGFAISRTVSSKEDPCNQYAFIFSNFTEKSHLEAAVTKARDRKMLRQGDIGADSTMASVF